MHLLEVFLLEHLLITIRSHFVLEPGFVTLNVEVDVEFRFKIFCQNLSRSSDSVFVKVFDETVSRKFVDENDFFFLLGGI
jgi:hypothetical protein